MMSSVESQKSSSSTEKWQMVILKRKRNVCSGSNNENGPIDSFSSFSKHHQNKKAKMLLNSHHSSSHNTSKSHSHSTSSGKYNRPNPDEFDVYNINPPRQSRSLCQKACSLIRSHWLLIQVIIVICILGLPGNIVTTILYLQKPTHTFQRLQLPTDRSKTNSTTTVLHVSTTAQAHGVTEYQVDHKVADRISIQNTQYMAHTNGYRVVPASTFATYTQSAQPNRTRKRISTKNMINSLTSKWVWFGPYKNHFCQIREPEKALSEHLTPGNKHQVWTDILNCIVQGSLNNETNNASQEHKKIDVLRYVLCDEGSGDNVLEGPTLKQCVYTATKNCFIDQNCKNNPSQDLAVFSPTLLKELEEQPGDYFCKSNMSQKDLLLLDNAIDNFLSNQELDSQRKLFCSAFNNNQNNPKKIIATYLGQKQQIPGLITCIWSQLNQVPDGSAILNNILCTKNYTQLQNYKCIPDISICVRTDDTDERGGYLGDLLEYGLDINTTSTTKEKAVNSNSMHGANSISTNNPKNFNEEFKEYLKTWYDNRSIPFCSQLNKVIARETPYYLKEIKDEIIKRNSGRTWNLYVMCLLRINNVSNVITIDMQENLWYKICSKKEILMSSFDDCSKQTLAVINNEWDERRIKNQTFHGNRIDYELPTSPTLKNDSQRILQIPSGINDIESLESENYTCHESFETHSDSVVSIQFWLEGVGLCVTGAFGLIGNLITFQVLKKQRPRSSFHQLLMTLAVVDCILIAFYIVDSSVAVWTNSDRLPFWYRVSFPYFWHPGKAITLSSSIFMVVAISAERYKAICYPLRHRPASWQYILFVVIISVLQNIPKFFEFQLIQNNTDSWSTPLSENRDYIRFSGWWDELFVTGFAPFVALVFFNIKIYVKIRASTNYRYRFVCHPHFKGRRYQQNSQNSRNSNVFGKSNTSSGINEATPSIRPRTRTTSTQRTSTRSSAALQKVDEHMEVFELPVRSVTSSCCHCLAKLAKLSATPPIKTTTAQRPGRLKAKRKLKIQRHQSSSNVNNANGKPNLISDLKPDDLPQVDGFCCGHAYLKLSDEKGCACLCPQCIDLNCNKVEFRVKMADRSRLRVESISEANVTNKVDENASRSSRDLSNLRRYEASKIHITKRREKSTIILVLIVIIFFVCHFFRFGLETYELTHPGHVAATKHYYCFMQGKFHVPVLLYGIISAKNYLLVLNSSVNFIIYCLVEENFRAELCSMITSWFVGFWKIISVLFRYTSSRHL